MSWRFNPPLGWPVPATGDWMPPRGWTPDRDWPPAPPGWEFWVYTDRPLTTATRTPRPSTPRRSRRQPGLAARVVAAVAIAVLSVLSLAVSAGLHFDLH